MGRFWARCTLGSDLSPRSITTVTDLGIVGGCHLTCGLVDHALIRSHPNKAVDVVAYRTFSIAIGFRAINACLLPGLAWCSNRSGSFSDLVDLSLLGSRRLQRSLICRGAAAHTPLPSPRAGAITPPTCAPLLPPLSSSHSSRLVRIAAVHTAVNPCRVRTALRYTARSLPAAGAPSCPPPC